MKDLLFLFLQLVGGVCLLGSVLSVIGIIWGKPMHLKGAAVPDDWRAAVSFLIVGVVCFAIVYLAGRKKKAASQNNPD
jgi:hypothetical protein